MPKVKTMKGMKHFPYTEKGMKAAKTAMMKAPKAVKSGRKK